MNSGGKNGKNKRETNVIEPNVTVKPNVTVVVEGDAIRFNMPRGIVHRVIRGNIKNPATMNLILNLSVGLTDFERQMIASYIYDAKL